MNQSAPLVLVFGTRLDIPLARYALKVGARGFIHAGMKPEQITRAISVAMEGKLAAPRRLLEYLLTNEEATFKTLSSRQREVLELVDDGLSYAQTAKMLFLTESTVK